MIVLDGGGITGYVLHYAFVVALTGSTLFIFLYLWRKGRLDMDEDAKVQMLQMDEEVVSKGSDSHEKGA